MIGRLRGILLEKKPPQLLLDVQGVCYEIEAPMSTFYVLPEAGADLVVHTHLIVREDAHLLYGFASLDERRLFRALIKVNGVGAKLALTILSGIESAEFAQCIQLGDMDRLVRLPGIGKKTAERLIVEMRDRLKDWETGPTPLAAPGHANISRSAEADAISALINLGYKPQEASRMVLAVAAEAMSSEAIIREALRTTLR
jgi:Holliday junction DNA helicase RuvA